MAGHPAGMRLLPARRQTPRGHSCQSLLTDTEDPLRAVILIVTIGAVTAALLLRPFSRVLAARIAGAAGCALWYSLTCDNEQLHITDRLTLDFVRFGATIAWAALLISLYPRAGPPPRRRFRCPLSARLKFLNLNDSP